MAALPYIQLYVADYLADTMHLTTEEHGAYLLLIMNYWQTGHAIPKKRLASVARMSNARWTDVENTLSEFFIETPTGEWFHPRIEADLARVHSKSKQAKAAGRASAAKRGGKQTIENTTCLNGRSTGVDVSLQRNGNHTDTDTDTDTDIITPDGELMEGFLSDEHPPAEPLKKPPRPDSDYFFIGKMGRILKTDTVPWEKSYHTLTPGEALGVLQKCDDYYSSAGKPEPKMFFRYSAWLQKEHQQKLRDSQND